MVTPTVAVESPVELFAGACGVLRRLGGTPL